MYKKLITLAKRYNIINLEVNEQSHETIEIETFDEKLDNYQVSKQISYNIKAIYNGKLVSIYTENMNNHEDIIKEIINTSKILDTNEELELCKTKEVIKDKNNYKLETNPKSIIEKLTSFNKLKEQYPKLKNIICSYSESIKKLTIKNNYHVNLNDSRKMYYFYVEVSVSDKEKIATDYKKAISLNDDINMEELVKKSIESALDRLETSDFNQGKYTCLLTNNVASDILKSFIPLFSSEKIDNKTSLLENKLDKQVFGKNITIIEDPRNEKLPGKRLFDDEGTITMYKEIVSAGIFKTILYNNKRAKMNKTNSTGNGYNGIGVTNMYLQNGTKSEEELIKTIDNGLIINEVQGLHSGININNGDISLQSKGYYVENGKIKHTVDQFIMSINIITLLNNVKEIADNLEYNSTVFNSASLLIENISISK